MLVLGSSLKDTAVMSLQTGTRLARVELPLIDPANLKIVAYAVDGPLLTDHPSYLATADIREIGAIGMIIDSNDELVALDDVIKFQKLHDLGFKLVGMQIIDEHKRKLGKVSDYTVDTKSFVIQQMNVSRGFLQGINDTGLLVHRSQIVEINDKAIIVKSGAKKSVEPVLEATRHEYVNPFRTPAPEAETV